MKYNILFLLAILVACKETTRYPCQDINKWDTARCKPPVCTVHEDCPEDLLKPGKRND